jgi:hypothetical protein
MNSYGIKFNVIGGGRGTAGYIPRILLEETLRQSIDVCDFDKEGKLSKRGIAKITGELNIICDMNVAKLYERVISRVCGDTSWFSNFGEIKTEYSTGNGKKQKGARGYFFKDNNGKVIIGKETNEKLIVVYPSDEQKKEEEKYNKEQERINKLERERINKENEVLKNCEGKTILSFYREGSSVIHIKFTDGTSFQIESDVEYDEYDRASSLINIS